MHTKGPWGLKIGNRLQGESATIFRTDGVEDDSWHIAIVTIEGTNKEQMKEDIGNAHLIATAPDLLAALEWVENELNGRDETAWFNIHCRLAVKAAIAKAKGAS